MDERRSRLDIILSVLSAIRDGAEKPTRIMYASNLSWGPIQKILASLVEQELVTEFVEERGKRSKRRFLINEKGLSVIDYFAKADSLFDMEILTKD